METLKSIYDFTKQGFADICARKVTFNSTAVVAGAVILLLILL